LVGVPIAWLPVVPLAVYGAWLMLQQNRAGSPGLDTTVKDSPYFLGFILTLAGLWKIFQDIGSGPSLAGNPQAINHVVGQAGSALLATVVGLFCRQVLWSRDKAEEGKKSTFQDLSDALRDQAVDYRKQQEKLVELVTEFGTTRQRLFAQEEAAHDRYLQHLEQTSDVVERFNAEYPSKLHAVLEGLEQSGETISHASSNLAATVAKAGSDLAQTYSEQTSIFVTAVKKVSAPIGEAGSKLAATVSNFETLLDEGSAKIKGSLDRFAQTVGETPESLLATATSLKSLRENAAGLDASVRSVINSAASIDQAIATLVKNLAADSNAVHADVQKRAETLRKDIVDIDVAFDELMVMMRKRLLAKDIHLNPNP
jgi:hypothetical protein